MRQQRTGMPSRWKTSGLLGSRRANAATNRESTCLIGRSFSAYWALIAINLCVSNSQFSR